METKIIYTRRMAYELRKKGFKIIKVIPDENKPQFDNYVFINTPELQEAMSEYTKKFYG